jgi:hypothetical protein
MDRRYTNIPEKENKIGTSWRKELAARWDEIWFIGRIYTWNRYRKSSSCTYQPTVIPIRARYGPYL